MRDDFKPNVLWVIFLAVGFHIQTSVGHSAVILADDFDSYNGDYQLGTNWSGRGPYLSGFNGNPGQSLFHDGNALSKFHRFSEFVPTSNSSILYSVDILDDGRNANKRVTAGMRSSEDINIVEMGMYNSPGHYAYRTVLFDNSTTSWVAFDDMIDDGGNSIPHIPLRGWHRFSVLISEDQALFTLDLYNDGFVNGTAVVDVRLSPQGGFDIVRLGGPSNLSSPGGGACFDNILLETRTIPEPSPFVLILLGLAGFRLAALRLAIPLGG